MKNKKIFKILCTEGMEGFIFGFIQSELFFDGSRVKYEHSTFFHPKVLRGNFSFVKAIDIVFAKKKNIN